MQLPLTVFILLTAITIGVIAKKRQRNPWGWGILAALLFLAIDTVVMFALIWILNDSLNSEEVTILTLSFAKLVVFAAFVAVFNANL